MRRLLALTTMAVLAVVAPAAAQDQQTPPPPPAPAGGQLTVVVDKVGKLRTVVAGQRWRVRGDVAPYVAGQQVVVRLYRDGKKLLAKRAAVKLGAAGSVGHFKVPVVTKATG